MAYREQEEMEGEIITVWIGELPTQSVTEGRDE
jgi:hypothetical protein